MSPEKFNSRVNVLENKCGTSEWKENAEPFKEPILQFVTLKASK